MPDDDTRFAEIDSSLDEIERRLQTIARQNATLSEMIEVLGRFVAQINDRWSGQVATLTEKVEVLGRFVAVNINALTEHTKDGHGAYAS